MKMKNFESRPLISVPFTKRVCGFTLAMLVGVCLLLVSGCVFFRPSWPLLYKPSCDLNPVLTLHLPEHIDTLAECPRDKTIVKNGINGDGSRRTDDIKEFFYLTKGDTEYEFDLCFSDAAATHLYEFFKKEYPVFREVTADDRSGCVHYTEQPRADPEGGSGGMGYYVSRASFRLHNAYIHVTTRDNKPQSDKLTIAVKDLAQMLGGALSTNHLGK